MVGTHKGIHTDVTGHAAAGVRAETIAHDEQEALQTAFTGLCGIRKGVVVLLVLTTAAILARGEVLLLHEGRVGDGLDDKNGCGLVLGGFGVVGDHSVLNWKVVVL